MEAAHPLHSGFLCSFLVGVFSFSFSFFLCPTSLLYGNLSKILFGKFLLIMATSRSGKIV